MNCEQMRKVSLAALACGLSLSVAAQAAPSYSITNLGSSFVAASINNSGQIAGITYGSSYVQAALYSNGVITTFGSLGSTANDINDSGQIVGGSYFDGALRATLWQNGAATNLGALSGADYSVAKAINNAGQVTGNSTVNGAQAPFFYSGGNMTALVAPAAYSSVHDINSSGQIVGEGIAGYYPGAFVLANGGGTLLTVGAPNDAAGAAINDNGQVVADFKIQTPRGPKWYAFLYSSDLASRSYLGALATSNPSDQESFANDININGDVVGWSAFGTFERHGFLYSNGAMQDVNSLIDPTSGWTITDIQGINNFDQMIGTGCNAHGCSSVLLTVSAPVPEPEIYAMLLAGLGLMGFMARRRRKNFAA